MKKINTELNKVNVELVCNEFNLNETDFNNGSGIYCIIIGSRGEVESVEFADEYYEENELDNTEEFYSVNGKNEYCGFETFGVSYYEELGVEFVNVIV